MKKIIITLAALLCMSITGMAETTYKVNGKHITVETTSKKANKQPDKATGYTIEVGGKSHQVYQGSRGGLYYLTGKTGKNGKPEKRYLSKKLKTQLGL